MCLACVQSRRSLKDPWPACLGVFFVSVFEQRAHVKAQTTKLAHDLESLHCFAIVALTCGLDIYPSFK